MGAKIKEALQRSKKGKGKKGKKGNLLQTQLPRVNSLTHFSSKTSSEEVKYTIGYRKHQPARLLEIPHVLPGYVFLLMSSVCQHEDKVPTSCPTSQLENGPHVPHCLTLGNPKNRGSSAELALRSLAHLLWWPARMEVQRRKSGPQQGRRRGLWEKST